ncbi:MAG: response regulator [Anaerolineales bacterium]|nr:response regulator [Anaerolineales bacterium]
MKDARVLIVEDNAEVAEMLVLFFGSRGLKVSVAPDGASALRLIREALPTLILLDVGLPDTDGYELFKQFRQGVRTRYVPTIFLTRRSRKSDRLAGLQLGADDYISKPFDLEELYLRVQNAVSRAEREHLSNPHTGLPTGPIVREAVAQAAEQPGRAVVEFRLLHTSEFRDLYGALAGSDLLRYTALLINRVLNTLGAPEDFLGQSGEEQFVIITAAERAPALRRAVLERFDSDVVQHYALAERIGAQVKVRDTAGRERLLPLIQLQAGDPL